MPWRVLVLIDELRYPRAKAGQPPFAIETIRRIHYPQRWFALSDPAMDEALRDMPLFREFAKLGRNMQRQSQVDSVASMSCLN